MSGAGRGCKERGEGHGRGWGRGLPGLKWEGLGAWILGLGGGPGTWMPVSESGGDQEPRLLSPDSVWHLYPEDRRLSKAGQGLQDLGAPAKVVMVS